MKLVLSAILLGMALNNYAQNSVGMPSGNIGIGTASPQAKLHVANGDLLLQNTTSGYPRFRTKNLDGTKNLSIDYNSVVVAGDVGIIDAQNGLFLNGVTGANVGIGYAATATLPEKLSVNGNALIYGTSPYLKINDRLTIQTSYTTNNAWTRSLISNNIRWNETTNMWKVEGGANDDFSMMRFENNGVIGFYTRAMTGSASEMNNSQLTNYLRMFIDNTGNIGIATNDTKGYKLAVNGSAIFTSAKVKLQQNWPDYVFQKDYQLLPLPALEKFIQQNNHLPGIPAAAEVEKEGIDLGSNQAALLKKIEELTLYIIEQNKRIEKLEEKLKDSEKKEN